MTMYNIHVNTKLLKYIYDELTLLINYSSLCQLNVTIYTSILLYSQ